MRDEVTRIHSHATALMVGVLIALFLAACAGSPTVPSLATKPSPTLTATFAPVTTPTLGPAHYTAATIAHGFGHPDDIVLDAQRRIFFTDSVNGGVYRVEASGQITRLIGGLSAPEGILPLPDGSLLITVQGVPGATRDEILRLAAGATATTVFAVFTNTTGNIGLDSISRDPANGDILAADSPNGKIYRLSPDGRQRTLLASGFTRPVDAIIDSAGNVYVADEYGFTVVKLAPDGTKTTLAHLNYPDDLAFDVDGSLLVTELGHNILERIDPRTGHSLGTVATNLLEPQGLAVDARGDLFISEERGNLILELRRG